MPDFAVIDPAEFTAEELMSAARGEVKELKPQVAIVLLHAKLGDEAEQQLTDLARDGALDPRARHAATLELASFPSARTTLESLRTSSVDLVADAAVKALQRLQGNDE
jgi:hypothetical protein